MMLSISLMVFFGFLVADSPKFTLFWGTTAAFSFAAAFIIAAICLSADLIRRISNPISKPSPLYVGSPVNYFISAQGKNMSKIIDYETDLYTWALHNAQLLRQGRFAELDVEHLAEELEDMGNNKQELTSRFIVLIGHLLKWEYQPDHRSSSWRSSVNKQRIQINSLVRKKPSLKPYLTIAIADAYFDAVELASDDTGFSQSTFPPSCPYSQEQLLAKNFYPENQ